MSSSKIAMIAAFPPPVSGQSLAAQILRNGLDPEQFQIYELDLSESIGGDPLFKRVTRLGGIAVKLFALCVREKELIVYIQLGYGKVSIMRDMVYLAIARLFGKNVVVHVHGSGFRVTFQALPMPLKMIEQALLKGISTAIVLSSSLRPMFDGLISPANVLAVPNGVAPDVVKAATSFERPSRSLDAPFRILFLSNLLRMKGYETILRAAKLACQHGKTWHFDVVGPKIPAQGVDVEQYISENALEQTVSWHTTLQGEEKMACYKKADCFVLPSFFEGQPLTILEAMHFALPVVAKRVGGIPDIFDENPDGVAYFGEPVPFGSKPDLSQFEALAEREALSLFSVLQTLSNDPARCARMGASNRELARRIYTPQAHCNTMSRIFKALEN